MSLTVMLFKLDSKGEIETVLGFAVDSLSAPENTITFP